MGTERGRSRPIAEDSISESDDSCCKPPEGRPEIPLTTDPREYILGEVSVWIDPNDPALPMRKCTPEFFTMTGGRVAEGTELLAWTPEEAREQLLQEQVKALEKKAIGRTARGSDLSAADDLF